jgi:hypothetical protein
VWARRQISLRDRWHGAGFIISISACRVEDVVEGKIPSNPRVRGATCDREGEKSLWLQKEVSALGHVDILVSDGEATATYRIQGGRLADREIVPGIIGNIVGTSRLVNLQEVNRSPFGAELYINIVAIRK